MSLIPVLVVNYLYMAKREGFVLQISLCLKILYLKEEK